MSTAAPVIHIVDDDMSVRTAVGRVLRAAGYQVRLYESASYLLDHLPAAERGCILLDVQMPGLNGPQLQEVLSKIGFELPIIFLTGHGDIPTSVRAIKAGAEDFLSKPVPKKVLLDRDSPDDSQTGVSIRVLRSCRKTDARCRRLPAPRLARTVVEGLF